LGLYLLDGFKGLSLGDNRSLNINFNDFSFSLSNYMWLYNSLIHNDSSHMSLWLYNSCYFLNMHIRRSLNHSGCCCCCSNSLFNYFRYGDVAQFQCWKSLGSSQSFITFLSK